MINELMDPRAKRSFPEDHPLAGAVNALIQAHEAGDTSRARATLVGTIARLLQREQGASVASAFEVLPSGPIAMDFIRALDDALNGGDSGSDFALVARLFLIPVLFITAGKSPAIVGGVLPDTAELQRTLELSGALGPTENFGISNALATYSMASTIDMTCLFRATRDFGENGMALDLLKPEDIFVESAAEQVHLRYVAGAVMTAANAPTFLETAGTVGRWGMPVSQMFTRQLAEPGLQLLALPRAPMFWYTALAEGAFALEEIRFNLFLTSAIRELRASTGEPQVNITTRGGHVDIDLASQFDDMQRYAHSWRLHFTDSIERVETSILGLLRDCRVDRIEFLERGGSS